MAEESTALNRLHHLKTSCLTFVYGLLKRPQVIQLCDWSSIIRKTHFMSKKKLACLNNLGLTLPTRIELFAQYVSPKFISQTLKRVSLEYSQTSRAEIFSENTFVNTHNKLENFQPLITYYMSIRELVKNCRIQYILNVYSY